MTGEFEWWIGVRNHCDRPCSALSDSAPGRKRMSWRLASREALLRNDNPDAKLRMRRLS